jgi:hypothetical protein
MSRPRTHNSAFHRQIPQFDAHVDMGVEGMRSQIYAPIPNLGLAETEITGPLALLATDAAEE